MFSQAPHSAAPQSAQFVKIITVASAMVAQSVMVSSGVATKVAASAMVAQSSMTCDAGNTFFIASPMVTDSTMSATASAQMLFSSSLVFQSSMGANAVGTFLGEASANAQTVMVSEGNFVRFVSSTFTSTSSATSAIRHYWEDDDDISETWTFIAKPNEVWTDTMPFRRS